MSVSKSIFRIGSNFSWTDYVPTEYPDGSVRVTLPNEIFKDTVDTIRVYCYIKDSMGIVALPSLIDLIHHIYHKNNKTCKVDVFIPYVPHARQDRYTGNDGFTLLYSFVNILKTVKHLINNLTVEDIHSDACLTELSECCTGEFFNTNQVDLLDFYGNLDSYRKNYDIKAIIALDKGTVERAQQLSDAIGANHPVIVLEKTRDPETGYISYKDLESNSDLDYLIDGHVLMPDDIGAGCWSAKLSADMIKKVLKVKSVELILTHGVFARDDLNYLHPAIDKITVINDWRDINSTIVIDSARSYN